MSDPFGTFLFSIAVVGNLAAIALGIGLGLYRLLSGKGKLPAELAPAAGPLVVPLDRGMVLTSRKKTVGPDPVTSVGEEQFRVTWMGGGKYLVTRLSDSRRVGTFDVSGTGHEQEVAAHPDEEGQDQLLRQIALEASRREAEPSKPAPSAHGEHH